jgi:hypothetical protein
VKPDSSKAAAGRPEHSLFWQSLCIDAEVESHRQ